MRRVLFALLLAAGVLGLWPSAAAAHISFVGSEPADGTVLNEAPTVVRVSFTEAPERSLAEVSVVDADARERGAGALEPATDDPNSLLLGVDALEPGTYTVRWRVVSPVDGHPTSGSFSFIVNGASSESASDVPPVASPPAPQDPSVPVSAANPAVTTRDVTIERSAVSSLEVIGRSLLMAGIAVLLGTAFAGATGSFTASKVRTIAAGAWVVAVTGLGLLTEAQRRAASVSLSELWSTSFGITLAWRWVALGAAGAAVVVAFVGHQRLRRPALGIVVLAVGGAMAAHVAGGHAAAPGWLREGRMALQWTHLIAIGVWLGGLAALLYTVRGTVSNAKAAAARRFSRLAVPALVVVAATGVTRAADELSSWGDLTSTGYGRRVLAKGALTLLIAAVGAGNRWRSVPAAVRTLRPLRVAGSGELVLAAAVLVAAAGLASVAPPAAAREAEPPMLTAEGTDDAGSVEVQLAVQPGIPGLNRFLVDISDDAAASFGDDADVSLRFTSLDDPANPPTTLDLVPDGNGLFAADGSNLSLDGRWDVIALVGRGVEAIRVPLALSVPTPTRLVSVLRVPGEAARYTVQLPGADGYVQVVPETEDVGINQVRITYHDILENRQPVDDLVVSVASGDDDGVGSTQPVERVDRGAFVADVELQEGANTVAVVGQARKGPRFRAEVYVEVL